MMPDLLLRATIESALFVALVWVLNLALPRLTPAARATLWWCAAAKFVITLTWWNPIAVPVLPAAEVLSPSTPTTITSHTTARSESRPGMRDAVAARTGPSWGMWLMTGWIAGVALTLLPATRRVRSARRALNSSRPASEDALSIAAALSAQLRLRRPPDVRVSADVPAPMVIGLRRPVILLPAQRFAALSELQQRMALCHELQHLKRGDLWLGCIPALAERLFFFHPLAHLAAREYVFWRESACDTSVLAALNVGPQEYGRLLLDLGVARRPATFAAAAAPWSFTNLKRRILMLGHSSTPSAFSRLAAGCAVTVAFAALLPLQLAARKAAVVADLSDGSLTQRREVAPEPPIALDQPREGLPDRTESTEQAREIVPRSTEQARDDLHYVLFTGDDEITMKGSSGDVERARRLRRSGEPMLWFRQDGREYVVRDPEVLRQVRTTWIAVTTLGDQQGKLGEEQGALGARQGDLGGLQGELGAEQGRLGARQAEIAARQTAMLTREWSAVTAAERDAAVRDRRQAEQQMHALEREMRGLDAKMREFEKPMQELGTRMDALGSRMNVLGERMEEATRRAEEEMRALIGRAISKGLAERIK